MKPLRWGLIREQILVQLRTRTLNYFTLATVRVATSYFYHCRFSAQPRCWQYHS